MNQIEQLKIKVQKLVNQYNFGNYKLVIQELNILLKKLPNNPFLLNLLGSCYQKLGNHETAKKNFLQVLVSEPDNLAAMNNLGTTYRDMLEFEKAEKKFQEILKINSNYLNAIVNYANLKFQLDKFHEAINFYNQALEINNNSENIHYNIGLTYQSYGDFNKAEYHFREMLRINPKSTSADRLISRFTKYNKDSKHLAEMLGRNKTQEDLNDKAKINLYFALGKAFEDIKDFKQSFTYIKKANDLTNSQFHYDISEGNEFIINLQKFFDKINLNNYPKHTINKKIIFILGLPRSGTSLAEQIISSHSSVYGAGESGYLEKLIKKDFFTTGKLNFDILKSRDLESLNNNISQKYIDLLNSFKFSENVITEKDPLNFRWIGFIKLIFPNSKIIHCQRDLKDNFFSIYKNFFPEGLEWSYDQENLINYFKNYKIIMKYWHKKFPKTIYDLKYEDLINNSDNVIKDLVKFCELDWEENCLNFYNTKRSIKTLSVAEARKPIYKSSIAGSSNFDPFLKHSFSKLKNL